MKALSRLMTKSEARRVSCPECKSRAGHLCRDDGRPTARVHRSRWEKAENPPVPPTTRRAIENRRCEILRNAGSLWTRRLRASGLWVTLYLAREADIDCGTKYALVCEEHGSILAVTSEQRGHSHAASPEGWCPRCRGEEIAS